MIEHNVTGIIQQAAKEAVYKTAPCEIRYGTVLSTSPLQIQIEQKLTLGAKQLILSRNVTDYTVMMAVDHKTEDKAGGSNESAFALHNHDYKGAKAFLAHNALKIGEKVILLRVQGGHKFVVLDRLV